MKREIEKIIELFDIAISGNMPIVSSTVNSTEINNEKYDRCRTVLKNTFGYDKFLPLQEEVINHVLVKKDALVVLPTGGGKPLCYQLPGLIFDGLTVVVSPLISLMKDQVDQLKENGVPALFLNSTLSVEEYRNNVTNLRENKAKFLYLSP